MFQVLRFKFVLTINRQKSHLPFLPLQYQYPFSCWIYKMLKTGNPDYKGWLQRNGYVSSRQVFTFFTFSNLLLNDQEYEVKNDRLMLLADKVEMIFSFVSRHDATEFVQALFLNEGFSVGDKKSRVFFEVTEVIALEDIEFKEKMRFKSISPFLARDHASEESEEIVYYKPDENGFGDILLRDLLNKNRIFNNIKDADIEDFSGRQYQLINLTDTRDVILKAGTEDEQKITGYELEFEITAAADLIRLGYYGGFGSLTNTGFGCAEILEEEENEDFYRI